ncbi:MAG: hypothetical protein ED559_05255 [Phycisphaera sp.]|nr:MAG: hypothetical protein ED559_05255 [Phycisphaera sp.]
MKYTIDQLRGLARATAETRPDEIDCDEWLARVAAYIEARSDEAPLDPEMAAVEQHVKVCPDCRAELEALMRATEEG